MLTDTHHFNIFFRSCSHPSRGNDPIELLVSSQTLVPTDIFLDHAKKLLCLTVLFNFALFFTILYFIFGSSQNSSAFLFSADFRKARFGSKHRTDPTALLVLQGGLPADEAEHGGRRHGIAPVAHGRCDSPKGGWTQGSKETKTLGG